MTYLLDVNVLIALMVYLHRSHSITDTYLLALARANRGRT